MFLSSPERSSGKLGGRLDGVGVEEGGGVVVLGDAGELAEGLDGAGLVVGEHDGDQAGVGRRAAAKAVGSMRPSRLSGAR